MNWNHLLHIVRKDIRAQRFHLTVWALLLALSVASQAKWDVGQPGSGVLGALLAHLLPVVVMIYGIIIVVTLIHQDPVAGTAAFWMTRPVRGPSLLVAKASEAAAMVALWFVSDFLILAGNGVPGHVGYLAFNFATGLLPALLVVFTIAALVPTTRRFLLTLTLALIALGVVAMFLNLATAWFVAPAGGAKISRSLGERLSAQVVSSTIILLGALAIVGWQFVTRRTNISIIAALSVTAVAYLAARGWTHDFIQQRTQPAALAGQFDAVEVAIDSSEFRAGGSLVTTVDGETSEFQAVSVRTSLQGLPDGVFAQWGADRNRVFTADGKEFLQHPDAPSTKRSPNAGISAALGGATLAPSFTEEPWRRIIRAHEEEYEQFAHQPCRWESKIDLNLYRYDLLGELPLEAGEQGQFDGLQVKITAVVARRDGLSTSSVEGTEAAQNSLRCEVHFTEKFPIWKLKTVREGKDYPAQQSGVTYVLVNRKRNEAVLSNGSGSSSFGGIRSLFHIVECHRDFQPAFSGRGTETFPQIDEDWLAGASLAILKLRDLGEITRTATLKDVVFDPQP